MKWTKKEQRSLIRLYLKMFKLGDKLGPRASAGQISKAKLIRDWIEKTGSERSRQAIEMQLMNISAVLRSKNLPIVEGYKPLKHYSTELAVLVSEIIEKS